MSDRVDHKSGLPADATVRLFLCGDVMLGRGIDQVLPQPCDPKLHESGVESALDYVRLAECASGPIPAPVDFAYVWGAAIEEFERRRPDARIINLETSVTRSDEFIPKGINYRVSPENAGCLVRAGIDCCVLANNHVLDWGKAGLIETLATLERLGIAYAGAGRNRLEAARPAVLDGASGSRVVVFAVASVTSGVSPSWAAKSDAAGVNVIPDMSEATVSGLCEQIIRTIRPGDIVVASIHWGSNWGYQISDQQRRFAQCLIDRAGVSVVHGHSSHHAKAIEVYRDRLILYGCGDLLNDYEGITGYEEYRDDLAVMYFADVSGETGCLVSLEMVPLRIGRFRLSRASDEDIDWLARTLDRECEKFGARVVKGPGGILKLSWRSI